MIADEHEPIVDDDVQRFWARVEGRGCADGCWIWPTTGRVKLAEPGRSLAPRRMAWLLLEDELGLQRIDGDWVLRTRCGQERCVNPEHMEPVHKPRRDPDATTCARGHAMREDNGYFALDGTWVCRPCKREHMRRYREDPGFRASQAAATRRYMARHPEQAERKRARNRRRYRDDPEHRARMRAHGRERAARARAARTQREEGLGG